MEDEAKHAWKRMAGTRDLHDPLKTVLNYDVYENYDADITSLGYLKDPNVPTLAAQHLLQYLDNGDSDYKILDVGAGTGLVGEALRKCGFRGQISAIDGSRTMLETAKVKNIYDDIVCQYLEPDVPINEPSEYFNGIISVAAFSQGYVHFNVVKNLVKHLVQGGVLIISFSRFLHYEDYQKGLEECFLQLEKGKRLKKIEAKLIEKYFTVNFAKDRVDGLPTAMLYCYYKL